MEHLLLRVKTTLLNTVDLSRPGMTDASLLSTLIECGNIVRKKITHCPRIDLNFVGFIALICFRARDTHTKESAQIGR